MPKTEIRAAGPNDCAGIAKLFLISSDGLAEYIWGKMDMPGLSLIEIGAQRRRFGYRETGRRTIVPHPALHYSDGDAVLLVRPVDQP